MNYENAPQLSDDELSAVSGGTTPGIVGTVFVGALDDTGEAVVNADRYAGNLGSRGDDGASGGDDPNDSVGADGNYEAGWNASLD